MILAKLLRVDARTANGDAALSSLRACAGVCLSISLSVGAAFHAGVAHAAIPSLPPLPAYMPPDEAAAASEAPYNAPPLPGGVGAETPNPFRNDSADDATGSRVATPAAQSRADDAPDDADGSVPLGKPSAAAVREAAA
ncbi:MAG TPA: type IV pilus secretin PilQ, partial [Paraburkholderia sp.]